MPDWIAFRAAITAGTRPSELCRACELLWSCLDLPDGEARARLLEHVRSEADCSFLQEGLSLARLRLLRDVGVDPYSLEQRTSVESRVRAGKGTAAETEMIRRIYAAGTLAAYALARYPAGVAPDGDPDLAALGAHTAVLQAAIESTAVASPENVDALRRAIDEFSATGKNFGGRAAVDGSWWLGAAWWAYGSAALSLNRARDARDAIKRAAALYEQGGSPGNAAACLDKVAQIEARYAADFDAAAEREVRGLLEGNQTPLERVKSLTQMMKAVGDAGDRFEADRIAGEADRLLAANGFPDPEHAFDAAVDAWVASASTDCRGERVTAAITSVAGYWAAILGARTIARATSDPAGSVRADRAFKGTAALVDEIRRQAAQANAELAARLEIWHPAAGNMLHVEAFPAGQASAPAELSALDDALMQLRLECNEGASEAQLARALALQAQAEATGSRVHIARARIERAYVLMGLRRFEAIPAVATAAREALLSGQVARLSAFGTGFERQLYLMTIDYQAAALAATRDYEGALALLVPVIRDIEGERARVSTPYQQSAFMESRAGLYELAAIAAYRANRWDDVLAIGELLKARATLRSRLRASDAATDDDADARLEGVNRALSQCVPGTRDAEALREQRQWLLTARAIARARSATAALPEISVGALQATLAADECAITWLWVASDVITILAIARDDLRPALIKLTAAQRDQLDDYVAGITSVSGDKAADASAIERITGLVAALGVWLLPPAVRAFMAGRPRVILCPHRTLHLFPFHAAPWPGGYLIEHACVRYVPNLTSLLMPWSGTAEGPTLAVGVSTFDDPRVPPLPNADAEARAVAAAHGANGEALLDATRAEFMMRDLRRYRCLHFATHGSSVLTGNAVDDPLESCLHLRDAVVNGFELSALPLRAELVVLAACYSGQRSVAGRGLARLPGDDLFGLQGVLFEAGAGALLGALWPVDDEVARVLLTDFHRAYAAGAAPQDAWQTAVQQHLRDRTRPAGVFHWAPFFLSVLGRPGPVSRMAP